MNTFSVLKMDKDKGYAWVILGASTILMCVGPSTFTTYGFLLRGVSVSLKTKTWVLNLFYLFWLLSAFLVSCFVKQRTRQLATSGAAIAAIGFLVSASVLDGGSWLYLTFSLFVGFGLGLSFHTAYLVVMSNFDHYKGLANGICQLCIAIGQITTPFLFTIVSVPRDRFQIKALTAAIGFLTTLFFVVPNNTLSQRRPTLVGDRNRRPSTVSRRSSMGESAPLHSGFIPVPSNSIPINNQAQARPRRRSMYLLAVSTSLLPNIPEEPESTHSTNDTLTSTSSESDVTNVQESSLGSQSVAVISPDTDAWSELVPLNPISHLQKLADLNMQNATNGKDESPNVNQHVPLRRLSEGCLPSYVGNNINKNGANGSTQQVNKNGKGTTTPNKNSLNNSNVVPGKRPVASAPRIRRHSESQLQSNPPSPISTISNDFTAANVKSQENLQTLPKQRQEPLPNASKSSIVGGGSGSKKGESIIDLSLLRNYQFINMISFSSLCTMTVVNYPIVLYVHIINTCEGCTKDADIALIIIYMVDLISRLLFSYLADIAGFSKRKIFHIACTIAGVLIAATTLVHDVALIYCFCVVYGMCLGLLMTSEYLMFIECFGFNRFHHAYGFINLCKLVVISVLALVATNPLSVYTYAVHPLDQDDTPRNSSVNDDPTDLGNPLLPGSQSVTRILLGLAVCPILCTLAWLTEDIYKAALRRCSIPDTEKTETVP